MVDGSVACFYLDAGRNQQGPVSAAELSRLVRSGAITRDTLIWIADMPDWRPAGRVNELASLFGAPSGPPPMPPPQPSVRPPARPATFGGHYDHGIEEPRWVGFGSAIAICFRKYVDFSGRAGRPEFWFWTLFVILALFGLPIVGGVILDAVHPDPLPILFLPYLAMVLGLLLPGTAVTVRRLHDTDRSGAWILFGVFTITAVVLFVFLCERGTKGANQFGPQVAV